MVNPVRTGYLYQSTLGIVGIAYATAITGHGLSQTALRVEQIHRPAPLGVHRSDHAIMAFDPHPIARTGPRGDPRSLSGENPPATSVVGNDPHRPSYVSSLNGQISGIAAGNPHIVLDGTPRPRDGMAALSSGGAAGTIVVRERENDLAAIIAHPTHLLIIDDQTLIQNGRPARP